MLSGRQSRLEKKLFSSNQLRFQCLQRILAFRIRMDSMRSDLVFCSLRHIALHKSEKYPSIAQY